MTGIGHLLPRESTTSTSASRTTVSETGAPSFSRTAVTARGRTARNLSTSSSAAPSGSETRTFPSLSTPMARSTWLGVSVLLVQDEPDETEKPSRSSSCSSASPST